jgi:hypothetical protein
VPGIDPSTISSMRKLYYFVVCVSREKSQSHVFLVRDSDYSVNVVINAILNNNNDEDASSTTTIRYNGRWQGKDPSRDIFDDD